ncbi:MULTISPECIES: hypothetical protein [Streptomyces]|uniref:Uncharacterized protein n=1 Tax=Streptomyces spinosisporus TaxID=2927582 RepID=A0ABS9XEW9_9ACTN|nr:MULTISPECIES: hypothetical protein [Streptomyces]EPD56216.1 hypothetical protein HMPREF1211_07334 [Streptomyces sp. HGB0020]MCI3240643.1 hypothetical protein [Streptomyces spinosisporus]
MAQFLVLTDSEARGWRVDVDALTTAMRARWVPVEIDSTHRSEAQSFGWFFEAENGPGEAYLHEDGTCLYLNVWLEDAAWLAVVFRRLAPAHLDVVFCDEGYNFHVRLRPEATDAELTDLMMQSDPAAESTRTTSAPDRAGNSGDGGDQAGGES